MVRTRALGIVLPIALAFGTLLMDLTEAPGRDSLSILTLVPFIAAVFLGAEGTLAAGGIATLIAAVDGVTAGGNSDPRQLAIRLGFLTVATIVAAVAAATRVRLRDQEAESRSSLELAHVDPLTGLANRRGAERWIESRGPGDRTVLVCDADGLKQVNDGHGHAIGDAYLAAVAGRLRSGVATGDLVARWGGDEFVIVVAAPFADARQAAERLVHTVTADPVSLGRARVRPSLCIGIASWPADSRFADAFRRADTALYRAKARGSGLVDGEPGPGRPH